MVTQVILSLIVKLNRKKLNQLKQIPAIHLLVAQMHVAIMECALAYLNIKVIPIKVAGLNVFSIVIVRGLKLASETNAKILVLVLADKMQNVQ